MSVLESEVIRNAKNELIEKLKPALNLEEVKQILKSLHNLEVVHNIQCKTGEIIVHNNQLTYNMEFEVTFSLSVLLDGDGNYIPPEEVPSMTPEEKIEEIGSQAEEHSSWSE